MTKRQVNINKTLQIFDKWFREEFAPALLVTMKTVEPHIRKGIKLAIIIQKNLDTFVRTNREAISAWAQFAEVYPKLQPYVENIKVGLLDPDFQIANDVIRLSHIYSVIDLEKEPEVTSLMSVISGKNFQNSLISFYKNISLEQERLPLIEEALLLHNQKHYAGSICLLYSLLEGVITESFEKAAYIQKISEKYFPIKKDGTINRKRPLNGLIPKIEHAIVQEDDLKAYYEKIICYKLVSDDPKQTISKTRNQIMHGNLLDFNTEARSSQLILWLYSMLIHIQVLGLDFTDENK